MAKPAQPVAFLVAVLAAGCVGELASEPPAQGPTPRADAGSPVAGDAGGPLVAPDAGPPPPPGCADAEERAVIDLANRARALEGAGPLACDTQMAVAARLHSEDMCLQDYFSHTGRNGSSFGDRLRAQGVEFRAGGENIALGQRDPDAVHTAWMNSSGHRRNILNGAYARIGVGLHDCGGRKYWTQVFAD